MHKRLITIAFGVSAALAGLPAYVRSVTPVAEPQPRTWCEANAGRPVFGAVLCEAVGDGTRIYVRGFPFEVVAIGADYITLRPELSGERRRLLTIPFTAIRRLERTGRPREVILDQ
jgi:hypothetical protein